MTCVDPGLRLLEIGEFSLFKRFVPDQTTFVSTGAAPERLRDVSSRQFSPATAPWLLSSLWGGHWDFVFCFPPTRGFFEPQRGPLGVLSSVSRLLFRFQTMGAYLATQSRAPLIVLDFNDMLTLSPPALAMLDRCLLYFKRELPMDSAKALYDVAPQFRTHKRILRSKYFQRNAQKLRPISTGVPEDTVQAAVDLPSEKTVDVFFAGSRSNSNIRVRGFEQLRALADRGYVIDVCEGGLSKREYLERSARAWITWSPEGYGWECLRHYEAALCRSAPLISAPTIQRYQPMLDGVHAIFYLVEGDGLTAAVERALMQKDALRTIAESARGHVLAHHTHDRLCEHILRSATEAARSAAEGLAA